MHDQVEVKCSDTHASSQAGRQASGRAGKLMDGRTSGRTGGRPGSRLVEVDLSRLGPLKSSQVGFIYRRRRFPRAQSVLSQVDLNQNFWNVSIRDDIFDEIFQYSMKFRRYFFPGSLWKYRIDSLTFGKLVSFPPSATDLYYSLSLRFYEMWRNASTQPGGFSIEMVIDVTHFCMSAKDIDTISQDDHAALAQIYF